MGKTGGDFGSAENETEGLTDLFWRGLFEVFSHPYNDRQGVVEVVGNSPSHSLEGFKSNLPLQLGCQFGSLFQHLLAQHSGF